ncbi:Pistil-specific extensin-like protein [Capsicum baccatum]|uniref:Pistil-specific extensin-like protein n=1 Tax=Capsicum baccatum TaxID=33114 RepID=A0A2G2XEP1_CAPBA|nr:Pistil-specific extensin-like protein [Capsicum baccatum]
MVVISAKALLVQLLLGLLLASFSKLSHVKGFDLPTIDDTLPDLGFQPLQITPGRFRRRPGTEKEFQPSSRVQLPPPPPSPSPSPPPPPSPSPPPPSSDLSSLIGPIIIGLLAPPIRPPLIIPPECKPSLKPPPPPQVKAPSPAPANQPPPPRAPSPSPAKQPTPSPAPAPSPAKLPTPPPVTAPSPSPHAKKPPPPPPASPPSIANPPVMAPPPSPVEKQPFIPRRPIKPIILPPLLPTAEIRTVQGLVYCKSCNSYGAPTLLNASLLQGASVKLVCYNGKNGIIESATTNNNGVFLIMLKSLSGADISKCRVYLLKSPDPTCNVPTDFNGGKTGALLKQVVPPKPPIVSPAMRLPEQPPIFDFYDVGPFIFEASSKLPCIG